MVTETRFDDIVTSVGSLEMNRLRDSSPSLIWSSIRGMLISPLSALALIVVTPLPLVKSS
jgi:hypothetical protein